MKTIRVSTAQKLQACQKSLDLLNAELRTKQSTIDELQSKLALRQRKIDVLEGGKESLTSLIERKDERIKRILDIVADKLYLEFGIKNNHSVDEETLDPDARIFVLIARVASNCP